MSNILDFIKEKSYYFLGGTVLILIIIVIVVSCSGGGNSYEAIEEKMVNAAEKYYYENESRLPKVEGNSVKLTVGTMIDKELIKEIKDPSDKEKTCNGYVEVTKVGKDYSYTPFLVCKGNYEPKYLVDVIKDTKIDEYGNGLYNENGEYIYKGADVKNYVKFNNQLWRIVKLDSAGDIKLVLTPYSQDPYPWDISYNGDAEDSVGNNTNYLKTSIRKTLNDYYKKNFGVDSKAKIINKDICVGKYSENDSFSIDKECSVLKENEKIGLLNPTDYQRASLDNNCVNLKSMECINYNYLADDEEFYTWMLNSISDNTYTSIYLSKNIETSYASTDKSINPVIYISKDVLTITGKGSKSKPYVIK